MSVTMQDRCLQIIVRHRVKPSEETGLPKHWGFQWERAVAAGAWGLIGPWAGDLSPLLQAKPGSALASSLEPLRRWSQDCMQRLLQPALDSLWALLSAVLLECWQPAVRVMTQGWSVTGWRASGRSLSAAAAHPRMWTLPLPEQVLLAQRLPDAQAPRSLTARRRACMHCWAGHTPASGSNRLHTHWTP